MSLRYRLWLSFGPVLLLLTALGAGAVVALDLVGGRIDAILRENYRSVDAMNGLNEAVERSTRRSSSPSPAGRGRGPSTTSGGSSTGGTSTSSGRTSPSPGRPSWSPD